MDRLIKNVLALIALMIAANMPSAVAGTDSFSVISVPRYLSIEEPWVKVITNQNDWELHYNTAIVAVSYPTDQPPVVPIIDFENYQIISGGLGRRLSGGHYLTVESVNEVSTVLYIHVLDVRPGPSCIVTLGITHPSLTIQVKKTDKPLKLSVSEVIQQCDK